MARPHLSLILPPLAAPPATSAPPLLGAAVVRWARMLSIRTQEGLAYGFTMWSTLKRSTASRVSARALACVCVSVSCVVWPFQRLVLVRLYLDSYKTDKVLTFFD